MEKQQTAVDWLIEQMKQRESQGLTLSMYELEMFAEQAKEMEKEQIMDAFNYAQIELGMEANEYYEQFFKSE